LNFFVLYWKKINPKFGRTDSFSVNLKKSKNLENFTTKSFEATGLKIKTVGGIITQKNFNAFFWSNPCFKDFKN
jgi:hypothetical protein